MKRIAIIGAGISGLFIANLFKKNPNYHISIYEKNNSIDLEEGYGIQLSVNSVNLLNKINFNRFYEEDKFHPNKIDFYSINNSKKICELNISDFNTKDSRYTTIKRSVLINFLKRDLTDLIKTSHSISKLDQQNKQIKVSFENSKTIECDYLIISDGVFSKGKSLISNNLIKPKYNNFLAIRGIISTIPDYINDNNISLFLGPNFHHVIYPVNSNKDLNFIAIMKYKLSNEDQKNYSLFNENFFIRKILDKVSLDNDKILDNLKEVKIFPIFTSNDFYQIQYDNIHVVGDAFFAFPPSFAQGASQSIEGAYELFETIKNNNENNFFKNRVKKTKMINNRSKLNQLVFHLSNPFTVLLRNFFLKKLVKNQKFLKNYLGKIYKS